MNLNKMNLILTSLLNKLNTEKFIILPMSYFQKKKYLGLETKITEFYVKKIIEINIHLKKRLKIQDVILTHIKFIMKFYQNMEYLVLQF